MSGLLFDTSVWIDFLKGNETDEVKILTSHLEENLPVFICPVIIQEVLQGIVNDNHCSRVKESLLALAVLNENQIEAATGAASIYRKLRKKGTTIRSSNDCLIAWYALKNSLHIVHRDRDFDIILKNRKVLGNL